MSLHYEDWTEEDWATNPECFYQEFSLSQSLYYWVPDKILKSNPKWNFLFIIFCKIIFGIGKLLFWFFSFGYSWDYFVLYNEQVFFSTFFTIYNESKFMQNYPKGFWLCLVCVLIHFLTLWAALTLYGKQTFLYASFLSNICTSNLDLLYIQRKLPWKCHSLDS